MVASSTAEFGARLEGVVDAAAALRDTITEVQLTVKRCKVAWKTAEAELTAASSLADSLRQMGTCLRHMTACRDAPCRVAQG
jgi:hypothetical protein